MNAQVKTVEVLRKRYESVEVLRKEREALDSEIEELKQTIIDARFGLVELNTKREVVERALNQALNLVFDQATPSTATRVGTADLALPALFKLSR